MSCRLFFVFLGTFFICTQNYIVASSAMAPSHKSRILLNTLHSSAGLQALGSQEDWNSFEWISKIFAASSACVLVEEALNLPCHEDSSLAAFCRDKMETIYSERYDLSKVMTQINDIVISLATCNEERISEGALKYLGVKE